MLRSDESIAQFAKNASGLSTVTIDVSSAQVTQGFLHSPALGFEHEPDVVTGIQIILGHREAKFEWHIEARCSRPPHVQLNSREVVKGITAAPDEMKDSIQATGAARNL